MGPIDRFDLGRYVHKARVVDRSPLFADKSQNLGSETKVANRARNTNTHISAHCHGKSADIISKELANKLIVDI
jgi:hypothetical protein